MLFHNHRENTKIKKTREKAGGKKTNVLSIEITQLPYAELVLDNVSYNNLLNSKTVVVKLFSILESTQQCMVATQSKKSS